MALFIGTVLNKVDRKGRVSVPASFRAALAGTGFAGIVAFPSVQHRGLECCGSNFMERLAASLYDIDTFSERQNDLAASIFASAHQIAFDSEGRIVLPTALIEHTGIADEAAFVGQGLRFQIWEPKAQRAFYAAALERSRRDGLALKVRPPEGGKDGGA
ncbi:MAG TPA: division/cell wall cluster transcriptional repressor MraZ [Alphaproteobacteria bacterium]|nr:division/cell wall cluster transcriptional repressor MraZ [Alphaproteobacteria bacterium]